MTMPMLFQADDPGDPPEFETATAEVEDGALRLWETFLEALPRIGIAITFILVGWILSRIVRAALRSYWRKRSQTESFARVMSKVVGTIFLGVFVLAAVTVTFPSVKPVDMLAGLGFFSIAIGFAFQDILENTLSGMLLLFRQPFQSGDQIEVQGIRGTVEGITIRETRINTFDRQLVIIPNADVYKNAITVQTEHELRRDDFVVGVAYEADLGEAVQIIEQALAEVEGVSTETGPEALVTEMGVSTVNIAARFWTDPAQHNVVTVRSAAITAVKRALDDADVEMPADIVALQATPSFAAAVQGEGELTPGGAVAR